MRKPTSDESDRKTRKRLIDPKLRAAGWRVVRFDLRRPCGTVGALPIEEFPTDNGPADYALCVDGRLLGVVEVKRVTFEPQNTLTQVILAKAFRGELVPTEAELARAEGRPYEPASALLARVCEARGPEDKPASSSRLESVSRGGSGERASTRVGKGSREGAR